MHGGYGDPLLPTLGFGMKIKYEMTLRAIHDGGRSLDSEGGLIFYEGQKTSFKPLKFNMPAF